MQVQSIPICRDDKRRADILSHPTLNGIDFVEYELRPGNLHFLVVTFLKPLPDPPNSDPDGAYDLTNHPELVRIDGGARIVGIKVLNVQLAGSTLEIQVDKAGDFSNYALSLGWQLQPDGTWLHVIPNLDPQFSRAAINFKAGCPVDFDCRQVEVCPPERVREPLIDYLAKDYASFRRLLIDLIPQLNPNWLERSPADLGIALLELLAYAGDQLSYFQDAVANEAYLDTVRQRVSAKRHARLVDYAMHDGRNAWAFVHLEVDADGTVSQGARILSRITAPMRNQIAPPGPVIAEALLPEEIYDTDPALVRVRVFETAFPIDVHRENNTIHLHDWGNLECCLPRGSTEAYLYTLDGAQANRPPLAEGDYLLLEEVKGPITGAPADADPAHRQVVRIAATEDTTDPAYSDQFLNGRPQVWQSGDTPLPLLQVRWREVDALGFSLCLSARPPGQDPLLNISVARGNMVLADHGRTIREQTALASPVPPDEPFRLPLRRGPLTMQCAPDVLNYDPITGTLLTERRDLSCPLRTAKPAIALLVSFPTGSELWRPVPHLLDSPPFEPHFVADVDAQGRATLRFGDGEYGREPAGATDFTAVYRAGNGRSGNIGAEALFHIVQGSAEPAFPLVLSVRNPLAARDGVDAETIEEVRQLAPAAFRAEQFRAVTEADYEAAARKMPEVAGAVATFRWTGSWHTVFVGVDPRNPDDLITLPGGRTRLSERLQQSVRNFLTRYKLAGYDLEIRSAEYVPLEIDMQLCVASGHFRGDVVEAVRRALSNHVNFDRSVGFFHPDNFTFGQAIYLSRIYAAVEAVEGVDSLVVTRFQRFGKGANGELESGVLPIGPWEIARLDNDPNFMENGVLRISALGGK